MLTPEQIEGFRLAAGRLIDPINTYLLKDIARRIQDAGKLTSTAARPAANTTPTAHRHSILLKTDTREIVLK